MSQPTMSPRLFVTSPLLALLLGFTIHCVFVLQVVVSAWKATVHSCYISRTIGDYILVLSHLAMKTLQLGSPLDLIFYLAPVGFQLYILLSHRGSKTSSSDPNVPDALSSGGSMSCLFGNGIRVAVTLIECLTLAMCDIGLPWPSTLTLPAPQRFLTLSASKLMLSLPAPIPFLTLPAPEWILPLPAPAPLHLTLPFPETNLDLSGSTLIFLVNHQLPAPKPAVDDRGRNNIAMVACLVSLVIGFCLAAYRLSHGPFSLATNELPGCFAHLKYTAWILRYCSQKISVISRRLGALDFFDNLTALSDHMPIWSIKPRLQLLQHKILNSVLGSLLENLSRSTRSASNNTKTSLALEVLQRESNGLDYMDNLFDSRGSDILSELSESDMSILDGISDHSQEEGTQDIVLMDSQYGTSGALEEQQGHPTGDALGAVNEGTNLEAAGQISEQVPSEQSTSIGHPLIDSRIQASTRGSSLSSSQWSVHSEPPHVDRHRSEGDIADTDDVGAIENTSRGHGGGRGGARGRRRHGPAARAEYFFELRQQERDRVQQQSREYQDYNTDGGSSGGRDTGERRHSTPDYFIRTRRRQKVHH